MGTPWRKYNTHNSKKFLLSLRGRFEKLVVVNPGVCGVTGGSWSKEKLERDMMREACADDVDSIEVSLLRISMLEFIPSLAWPFWLVATLRVGLERRLDTVRSLRFIGSSVCNGTV